MIDIQTLAIECGFEGAVVSTTTYSHVSEDSVRAFANAVLEAAAERVKDIDAYCGGHGEPSMPSSRVYVEAIRAMKVTP